MAFLQLKRGSANGAMTRVCTGCAVGITRDAEARGIGVIAFWTLLEATVLRKEEGGLARETLVFGGAGSAMGRTVKAEFFFGEGGEGALLNTFLLMQEEGRSALVAGQGFGAFITIGI